MRAAIVRSNGYLDNVITRTLQNNGINGDFIHKVDKNVLLQYNAVIFTYQNNIPNISKVLEQIALQKKIQVIYVSNTMNIGMFYNLLNDVYFTYIEEHKLDFALPNALHLSNKFIKEIKILRTENEQLKSDIQLLKLTSKAKRVLMSKGFSEADAHNFIIQKAMELRISKKRCVNLIIENKIDI